MSLRGGRKADDAIQLFPGAGFAGQRLDRFVALLLAMTDKALLRAMADKALLLAMTDKALLPAMADAVGSCDDKCGWGELSLRGGRKADEAIQLFPGARVLPDKGLDRFVAFAPRDDE